jgi:hypothetical protein
VSWSGWNGSVGQGAGYFIRLDMRTTSYSSVSCGSGARVYRRNPVWATAGRNEQVARKPRVATWIAQLARPLNLQRADSRMGRTGQLFAGLVPSWGGIGLRAMRTRRVYTVPRSPVHADAYCYGGPAIIHPEVICSLRSQSPQTVTIYLPLPQRPAGTSRG